MHVRTDGRGLVTGGADKDVKFWDIEDKRDDVCANCPTDRANACRTHFELAQIDDDLVPGPH